MKTKNPLKNIAIVLIIILLANSNVFAKITGKILSQQENSPMPSATVALHKLSDSSVVTGAVTNKEGFFSINANEGEYFLEIKFMGYENKIIPNITVTNSKPNIDLGEIKIMQTAIKTSEVTVEAEKELVEIGIDSKTFNITKDLVTTGGNVIDVLRNIPSISIDLEDNIKMNGNAPKILVDGKESNYTSKEMLKSLPSDIVESVELITNPSAKYEAEGVSGIINIKLKKDRDDGFNGMISAFGGGDFGWKYQKNGGIHFNGNYKIGKLNLFSNISYNHWNGFNDFSVDRKVWSAGIANPLDTVLTKQNGEYNYDGFWTGGGIGADYNITDNDMITLDLHIGGYGNDNSNITKFGISKFDELNSIYQPTIKYDFANEHDYWTPDFNIALNYKKNFAEKGHTLYVDAYISSENQKKDEFSTKTFYPVLSGSEQYEELMKNLGKNYETRKVLQVDYEKTLKYLGNFGAGAKAIFRNMDENNDSTLNFNNIVSSWNYSSLLSNPHEYKDAIYSAYFMFGNKIPLGKEKTDSLNSLGYNSHTLSYRLGLRAEYTDWQFNSNYGGTSYIDPNLDWQRPSINSDNYLSWIPTVHLKYSLGISHTFSVGYSRRLNRPWYSQFDPFISLYDSTSINSGNPDLQPSYYNSYQADYMFFNAKTTITLSLFHNNTDNASEYFHTVTPWGGLYSRPINVAEHSSTGASVSYMQTVTNRWNFNIFVNLRNTKFNAPSLGEMYANREQTYSSVNLNTTFKLLENLRLQIFGNYIPKTTSLQGENAEYYTMSAGLNYDFWENRMNIGLNLRNLIYPNKTQYTNFGDNFASYSTSNWMKRSFSLSLSYKINNYQQKQGRNIDDGGGSSDDSGGGQKGGV